MNTRVLIVEREPLISMMIEEMIADIGGIVCAVARSPDVALRSLENYAPDVTLLELDLENAESDEVADACRAGGIPIVVVTGYRARDLPAFCAGAPVLTKPFAPVELECAIRRTLATEVSV